ncbi:MAG TPA: DUF222 domain-containing protein [Streptosporangiaceae bacterium]|nr:DUF222 domain-containing protein [Streptosporangiaceae bacterium]
MPGAAERPAEGEFATDVAACPPLAAGASALDEMEVPPEVAWDWPDPGCGRPAELAGLTFAELDALPFTTPARYAEPGWLCQPTDPAPVDSPNRGIGFADGGVLDTAPAGPALAGFAEDAQAQLGAVTDDELIGVIRAWRRLSSWAAAREMEAVAALARRRPADGTPPASPGEAFPAQLSEFVPDEIAAALTLTPLTARREAGLAVEMAGRLAPVRAELAAGWIDLPKARQFAQATFGLTDEHASAVVTSVLPKAPDMTCGQLRRALDRAVLAADPEAARRQREEAVKHARVDCWPDPCGTANLAGRNLPAAGVLAASKRLDGIAHTWRKLGATADMDLLRAHAYLAQLLGDDTAQPPADLLPAVTTAQPPADLLPAVTTAGSPEPGTPRVPPMAGAVNLTVPLTTLLGLGHAPGEAAGYGPLDPGTARALACAAAGHRATRWHVTVTGPTGRALGYGSTPGSRTGGKGNGWQVSVTAEPIAAGCCDHRTQEPQYRPSPALQRIIRARTTTCSYYGCGRTATRCDLDHTIAYDDGGVTCECDLAPLCRRHHRLKQSQQWGLEQVSPGVMAWLTPAGRRYVTVPSQHPT